MNKILFIDDFYFLISKTIVSFALFVLIFQLFSKQNFVTLYAFSLLVFSAITYTIYLMTNYKSKVANLLTVSTPFTQLNFFQNFQQIKKFQIPFNLSTTYQFQKK